MTTELGNLFMMRLAAFVRDRRARLLKIDEKSAQLEIGGRSFADWFFGREFVERTRIDLDFANLAETSPANPTSRLAVQVAVRPAGLATRDFDRLASFLLRDLRGYFAAV